MSTVQIVGVSVAKLDLERLWGCSLDRPVPGSRAESFAVEIAGWVLGREAPAVAVEVVHAGVVLRRVSLGLNRPDVASAHPEVPGAEQSGFRAIVSVPAANEGLTLLVRAILSDQQPVPLGAVQARAVCDLRAPAKRKAVILLYHRVAELRSDPWELSVTPRHFADHLEILRQHGRPLRLRQLVRALRDGNVPDRSVVVTFDDGYADNFCQARPLLERYEVPATFFLTTGYLGHAREFWWDELERLLLQPGTLPEVLRIRIGGIIYQWGLGKAARYHEVTARHHRSWRVAQDPPTMRHRLFAALCELLRSAPDSERQEVLNRLRAWAGATPVGRPTHRTLSLAEVSALARGGLIEIGAHSVTHSALSGLPTESQRGEVQGSKARLEELIDGPVTSFAYPFGGRPDYGAETVAIVREAGFTCACANVGETVGESSAPFELPRVQLQDWDGETFAHCLSEYFHG
jgi:peptidoglycan/xylan/chitin deacetylase (PgdA/CDA1 family)